MAKISVIIPVYNVEEYVQNCIKSVQNQTFSNIEIILVDDKSTDHSGELCNELALQDNRIRVIHREKNGGLSAARNSGLNVATGTYLTFVDSDDTILPSMLQTLYDNLIRYDADISMCRYSFVWENKPEERIGHDHQISIWQDSDSLKEFLYGKTLDPFVCGKLYKRDVVGNLRFQEGITGEDVPFNYEIFKKSPKTVLIGESLYMYLQKRQGAICTSKISRQRVNSTFRWESIRQDCELHFPDLEKYALRRQTLFYIGLYNRLYDEREYFTEAKQIRCFLKKYQSQILTDNIFEKTTKLAVLLLANCPVLYLFAMKAYKTFIGEARI